jgi:gamma-carbonic anhydrase
MWALVTDIIIIIITGLSIEFAANNTRLVGNSLIRSAQKAERIFHWQRVVGVFKREAMSHLASQLDTFLRRQPTLGKGVYITSRAVVLGDVTLGDYSSVWYNAVLRGDINRIIVGHHSNIQDNSVLHLADDLPCVLGNYVTVGHSAIVHACTVGDECLIGMGSTILDGSVIGDQCIIGANALVTQNSQIPAGSLVLGSPAKIVRPLTPEERASLKSWAEKYVVNAAYCLEHGLQVGQPLAT